MGSNKARQIFYLNQHRDAELIAFLASLDNKSEFIRDAIYEKMARQETNKDTLPSQSHLDLAEIGSIVRQAVRDELTIARLTFGSSSAPDPDEEKCKEQDRKLTALFNSWDDEDDGDGE